MARTTYGGSVDDVIITPVTLGGVQVAGLPSSQSFQVWNYANSLQLTDVQDGSGIALPSGIVVSSSAGVIPQFKAPDGYTGPIRLKHPTTGLSWVLQPSDSSSSSGASLPNTLVVAASNSGITSADYVCDGTADDVQINAAVAAVKAAGGGTVMLTGGTYAIASPVLVEGFDDVDVEVDIYLRGQGPKTTTLAVASGVSCGIRLGKSVRAHVWDLGLTITGASDGIQAVASATPAAGHRSAWLSTISRVQVLGPFTGTDTGWAFDLDNVFRTSVADIEINGTTNGIRLQSTNSNFNPGDMTFNRCFVDIGSGGNGGTAYAMESTAGQANQVTWITCHGIGNPAATGQACWRFTGASAHVRTINCNAEQFATTVSVASSAYDLDIDLVHVTVRNGATLFNNAGYNNRFRCGLAYIEPSATVSILTDSNAYSAKPSVYGPIDIYGDTSSTSNATVGSTAVLRDIVLDGGSGATFAAALRRGPARDTPPRAVTLTDAATIATNAALGNLFDCTITASRTLGVPTNPLDGQVAVWRLTASGGSWTPVLTTGAGGFVLATGSPAVTVAAIASGSIAEIEATYSSAGNRWRVNRYSIFSA